MNRKGINRVIALWLVGVGSSLWAWDSTGHKVIAQIAYYELTPATRAALHPYIAALAKQYPKNNTFVKASTWADELKVQGINTFNRWHFINQPIVKYQPVKLKSQPKQHVVWAISQSEKMLRSSAIAMSEKARFLAFYIHFIGDVHQPLHAAELYSTEFPKGDLGGNRFYVQSSLGNNLHEIWDRGVGYFNRYHGRERVKKLAIFAQGKYPRQTVVTQLTSSLTPTQWAKESRAMARDFVYQTPLNAPLSTAYIQKGQDITIQQLALAGYRLADRLNNIFDPKQKKTVE